MHNSQLNTYEEPVRARRFSYIYIRFESASTRDVSLREIRALFTFVAHEMHTRMHVLQFRAESTVSSRRCQTRERASSTSLSPHDPSRADSDRRLTTSHGLYSVAVSTVSLAPLFRRRLHRTHCRRIILLRSKTSAKLS